ncbi:VCBS repeat-containing protein [Candidatus Woesearchaeota archaeon]|jgi:hypothetical protein|nr:VCBS repeat-containing protein [Candidatus Woesearchaeota archaeon]MBT7237991.1 VCBS repeat-containing protein [Candidatus Woesearchaeota archaeon]
MLKHIIKPIVLGTLISLTGCGNSETEYNVLKIEEPYNVSVNPIKIAKISGPRDSGIGIATGDMDNDGDLDILIAGSSPDLKYFENKGGGNYATPIKIAKISGPRDSGIGIALGDMDNDGDLDILIAGSSTDLKYIENKGQFF